MICTDGNSHPITSSTVFATLGIGWAAFVLSLVFNILYYALHPSQVTHSKYSGVPTFNKLFFPQVDILNIREKLVVAVVGYEINLATFDIEGFDYEQNIFRK